MSKTKKLPRGIRRRGDSLVVCFALPDGSIERRSLGPVDVAYAKGELAIFKKQVAEGTYEPWKKRQAPKPVYTVGSLWEPYLRNYRNEGGRDAGRLEIAWNHLKPSFEKTPVADLTTGAIDIYISTRRAVGIQNGTINRELATLRAMLHHGTRVTPVMVERMPAFPARLEESAPRQGFITDKEYAVLAANAKPLWLRAFIACAYSFGFRKGELLNLRVRQVDLLDRWIHLEEGSTKNGEARKVKMTTEVFELLCGCVRGKNADEFVFTRDDGSRVVDFRDDWYNLCVFSKLGRYVPAKRKNDEDYLRYVGLNPHDFRRSSIRNMVRRGVTEKVAMLVSGHSTRAVFDRYNLSDERDLADATAKIEAGRLPVLTVTTDTKTDTPSYAQ